MRLDQAGALALVLGVAAAAFVVDVALFSQGLAHGAVVGLLAAAAGASAALFPLGPSGPALAAATLGAWALVHEAGFVVLVGAVVVGGLFLVPAWGVRIAPVAAPAALAAIAAGGTAFLVTGASVPTVVAAVVASALAALRPRAPTTGTVRALRSGALFFPAVALGGLFALNAVEDLGERLPVRELLAFALGTFAVVWLVALAVLGLTTLVESSAVHQAHAWMAFAAFAGASTGALLLRDVSRAVEVLAVGAVPVAVLAAIATLRVAGSTGRGGRWWLALPLILALASLGPSF